MLPNDATSEIWKKNHGALVALLGICKWKFIVSDHRCKIISF
jgi:hypothetical protein